MIPELGHFALILAFVLALVQGTLPLIGAARSEARWMAVANPAAVGQFGLLLLAFLALMYAFVVSDFTVSNVVQNSHSAKPMLYKITGVWGNHEGSMVLWVLILALFGAMVALFGRNLPPTLKARTSRSMRSSGNSDEYPYPPCSCMAASITSKAASPE